MTSTKGNNGKQEGRTEYKNKTDFFFIITVNQEPFMSQLHDRMSKLDLRAKQPQPQT